jgi:hypothetical protein
MRMLGLLFALLLSASIHEAMAQQADLSGILPGDRWAYEVTDEVSGDLKQTTSVVVLTVSDKEINARVMNRGEQRPIQIAYDRNWNRLDDEAWKYLPSDGTGIQIPLQVGKEWRYNNKASNFGSGTTVSRAGQSKVVAQESVTTPAGSFDTFKIESTIRQINSTDYTKAATVTSTMWYAPTVNRWVRKVSKLEIEGRLREALTEELTDYSRKP